jgi:hypothetical protein
LARKWLARLLHPFTREDHAAGYRYEVSILETEFSAHVLRPDLSEVGSPELPQDTALRRAFAQLERTMDQYVNQAKLSEKT